MRGEDLQGLNLEDLKRLERVLEVGLARVLQTKVFNSLFFQITIITLIKYFSLEILHITCVFNLLVSSIFLQENKIMSEINALELKVILFSCIIVASVLLRIISI